MKNIAIFILTICSSISLIAQETLQTVTERGNNTNMSLQIGGASVNANTTKLFINNPSGKNWALSSGANMITEQGFHIYNWTDKPNLPLITINNDGYVGIGTYSPQTPLNVNIGSGGLNGLVGIRVGGTGNYASLELGVDGDYDGMIRSYGNNLNYYAGHWRTNGNVASENHSHKWFTSKIGSADWSTVKMILNQDGNLGIGTVSPTYKLDVIGTIRSREVKVDMNGADFVFEDKYPLMPLNELEKYIKTEKHLPEIAPAKEMESEGVELGKLNSKLLQKTEELTLYIIEQNKKIELLFEALQSQNKKNELLDDEIIKLKTKIK